MGFRTESELWVSGQSQSCGFQDRVRAVDFRTESRAVGFRTESELWVLGPRSVLEHTLSSNPSTQRAA